MESSRSAAMGHGKVEPPEGSRLDLRGLWRTEWARPAQRTSHESPDSRWPRGNFASPGFAKIARLESAADVEHRRQVRPRCEPADIPRMAGMAAQAGWLANKPPLQGAG